MLNEVAIGWRTPPAVPCRMPTDQDPSSWLHHRRADLGVEVAPEHQPGGQVGRRHDHLRGGRLVHHDDVGPPRPGDVDQPLGHLLLGLGPVADPLHAERDVVLGVVVAEHGDPGRLHRAPSSTIIRSRAICCSVRSESWLPVATTNGRPPAIAASRVMQPRSAAVPLTVSSPALITSAGSVTATSRVISSVVAWLQCRSD